MRKVQEHQTVPVIDREGSGIKVVIDHRGKRKLVTYQGETSVSLSMPEGELRTLLHGLMAAVHRVGV